MTAPAIEAPRRYIVRDADGNVVGKAELRKVPVASIKIDSAYQREVNQGWVHAHMPWDEKQAGAIVLSSRSGGPYCIDGGHRLALARESGVSHINAFVIDGLTQSDEARLFTRYQRERRNLTSHALYRADLVAQDPETVAMERAVLRAGFNIGKSPRNPHTIVAIDALRWIQRYGGEQLLTDVLKTVREFWVGEDKALSGQILKGVAVFLEDAKYQPTFRRETLSKVLNAVPPVKLLRLAVAVGDKRQNAPSATAPNVGEAIWEEYQKRTPNEADKLRPLALGRRRARPKGKWAKAADR